MAKVFCGDKSSIDNEIFELVKTLPDDYWIFAGFTVGREVDWFIARESTTDDPSAMILVELKRSDRSIKATSQDSLWEKETATGSWEPIDAEKDQNPYWQAVNTSNALKHWLWNNQRHIFLESEGQVPEDTFAVWPEVLILSPPGVRHYLPLRPTSRFGAWFTDADLWIRSVQDWHPRKGMALRALHLGRMAGLLGLQLAWGPAQSLQVEPKAEPATAPALFAEWLTEMATTIADLKARVERLEREAESRF